ncbi:hypothetical protein [Nioella sp.]|jgi:hypothetical protein|uniref:hypothetical protein n=1 Tax=Nioella sp. TaxID=1912091 RepID=UPI003A8414F9
MTPRFLMALLVVVLGLTGCASRLNPMNWFGRDREERVQISETVAAPVDDRQLVTEVISLSVDPLPGGAIVRAMGLPPRQGYWEADLVEVGREDGEIVFEFRVYRPVDANTRVGTQRSREILAGTSLTTQDLAGIRQIVVIAQQNRRSVSRR